MLKKKIILFEGELRGGKGHHYDHLVENSFYYKDRGEIIWVVNKKFNKKDLFIPDFVKVLNIIDTADRKIVSKNLKKPFWKFQNKDIQLIENGGWHFNTLLSPEEISIKLKTH